MLREPTKQFLHDPITMGSNGEKRRGDSFRVQCVYSSSWSFQVLFGHSRYCVESPICDRLQHQKTVLESTFCLRLWLVGEFHIHFCTIELKYENLRKILKFAKSCLKIQILHFHLRLMLCNARTMKSGIKYLWKI